MVYGFTAGLVTTDGVALEVKPVSIYKTYLNLLAAGKPCALAIVVDAWGSTPQKAGAKAIFEAAGPVHGTLGGGCLEAESRQRALRAIDEGKTALFELKLDDIKGWDDGLICGGKVRIFVDPNAARNAQAYRALLDAFATGARGALITELDSGESRWLAENAFDGELAEPLRDALRMEKCRIALVPGTPDREVFIEPVSPAPRVIIAGAGHIGKAVARQCRLLGFHVTVIDDRPAFANPQHIPDAHDTICGDIPAEVAKQPIGENTYVLIVTRGHRHDGAVLAACVNSPAAFIGMIGSRRKSALIRKSIVDEGLATEEAVARVVSPVGLDIGGESIEEIALSIAAQLVTVRRKRCLEAPSLNYAPQ